MNILSGTRSTGVCTFCVMAHQEEFDSLERIITVTTTVQARKYHAGVMLPIPVCLNRDIFSAVTVVYKVPPSLRTIGPLETHSYRNDFLYNSPESRAERWFTLSQNYMARSP